MSYEIQHASGITNKSSATTLAGAKREASSEMAFGGGTVRVSDGKEIWERKFWQSLNRFGWDKWVKVQ